MTSLLQSWGNVEVGMVIQGALVFGGSSGGGGTEDSLGDWITSLPLERLDGENSKNNAKLIAAA